MANRWGNNGNSDSLFSWAPKSLQMVTVAMKLKDVCSLEEKLWQTDSILKSREITLPNKGLFSQNYGFSSSHVWMWELNPKEFWVLKAWCFWTVMLEKTVESPLDCKIKSVYPKGNQSWISYWKDWCWSWSSNILATWCEELTHWKRPRCWKRLKAGGEGVNRGWDVWMASAAQWTWVWSSSRSWWWTRNPAYCSPWGRQDWTRVSD